MLIFISIYSFDKMMGLQTMQEGNEQEENLTYAIWTIKNATHVINDIQYMMKSCFGDEILRVT